MKHVFSREEKSVLWIQILISVVLIVIGVLFIYRDNLMWSLIYLAIRIALIASFVVSIYQSIRNRNVFNGLIGLGALGLFILLGLTEYLYIEIIAIIFGMWAMFNAAVHGLELYVKIKDNEPGKFGKIIAFLISFGMGLLLIFSGVENRFIINLQVGSYIILYGIVEGFSAVQVLFRNKIKISFSLPVFFAALIPNFLIKSINRIELENPGSFSSEVEPSTGTMLSVYLYAKDEGHSRIGHLDIGYRGSIYSYGAHDNYNRAKSMAYGDGVMIIGSEKDFVQYAVDTGTTVFRFFIHLTQEQASQIEARIDTILEDAFYYDYPYQEDPEGENYLTRLRQANLKVDFYKFKRGKFKTYNVFTTNCVLVADQIIESSGMRLIQISGVATPGAYYEYLESQLKKPGSGVIQKKIYTSKSS